MGSDLESRAAGRAPRRKARTFARMIASLTEEAEAIGWYAQRIELGTDKQAKAIMLDAQHEEFKHFGMHLEFLLRREAEARAALEGDPLHRRRYRRRR